MNWCRHVSAGTVLLMSNDVVGGAPWVMRMRWVDLLFAHWPMPVEALRPLVPAMLEIETFEGRRGSGSSRSGWRTSRRDSFPRRLSPADSRN